MIFCFFFFFNVLQYKLQVVWRITTQWNFQRVILLDLVIRIFFNTINNYQVDNILCLYVFRRYQREECARYGLYPISSLVYSTASGAIYYPSSYNVRTLICEHRRPINNREKHCYSSSIPIFLILPTTGTAYIQENTRNPHFARWKSTKIHPSEKSTFVSLIARGNVDNVESAERPRMLDILIRRDVGRGVCVIHYACREHNVIRADTRDQSLPLPLPRRFPFFGFQTVINLPSVTSPA